MSYGYLDSYFVLWKLATLAFSGAVCNNCTIATGSQPSTPQVPAAIPAKRRRFVIESDEENEM